MKRRLRFAPLLIVIAIAALVLSACSGSGTTPTTVDEGSSVTTEAPQTTEAPETTEAPAPTDAPNEETTAPSGDTGESTNSNTTLFVLLGIAVIVIIGLLAWLVGRNSGSSNSAPAPAPITETPPPAEIPPPAQENTTWDSDGDDTASPTGSGPSNG